MKKRGDKIQKPQQYVFNGVFLLTDPPVILILPFAISKIWTNTCY